MYMGETLKKGTRVTGVDRSKLATLLGKRYDSGESIRSLAASTGRSYGFVRRILTETGITLRGRGGSTRVAARRRLRSLAEEVRDAPELDIPVQIYLTDALAAPAVEGSLRELLLSCGVDDIRESPITIGSWYRSLTGLLKRAAGSDTAGEARRGVEIQVLDRFRAGIDGGTGDAVSKLIAALSQTKGAVIQVGSVLLVKIDDTIIVRHLTTREMNHWQDNPGLFKDPDSALAELQRANRAESMGQAVLPVITPVINTRKPGCSSEERTDQRFAVHRAIVVVDVEGFGDPRRTNRHQVRIRDGLYRATREAFERTGIPWDSCDHEDRGDGIFILVPAEMPKSLLVESLPSMLMAALEKHNDEHPDQQQVRLRMALHAGEVTYDEHGVTGAAVNLAFRLLDAKDLKAVLARSPGVLAVIVSSWFYEEVVRHVDVAAMYVPVHVAAKETVVTGWMCMPDHRHEAGQKG
jgi:class 3 adenylate cyclase